jgi:hypothetical protein
MHPAPVLCDISVNIRLALLAVVVVLASTAAVGQSPAPALDFQVFKTTVEPVFLHKRKGLARCYVCHSQGTPFRLQPLAPGQQSWSDEDSRKNFEAAMRFVVPGNPDGSRLLLMPLATAAGGVRFHPGGKHWSSKDDPEWQAVAAWIRAGK